MVEPSVGIPVVLVDPQVAALDMKPNVEVHLDRDPNDPRVVRPNRPIVTVVKHPDAETIGIPLKIKGRKIL